MSAASSRIAASAARTSRKPTASVSGNRSAAMIGGSSALSPATIAATTIAPPNPRMSAPGTIPAASSSASADTTQAAARRTGCSRGASGRQAVGSRACSVTPVDPSELIARAADSEGADDVGDALHQRPGPGEHEQRVGLLDEELATRPEGRDHHQHSADEAQPPERVFGLLDERPDRPPEPDGQEQEAEDVCHAGEGVLRADEADAAGDEEQRAEDRPEPAQRV